MNLMEAKDDTNVEEIISQTQSLCPVCLKKIPATNVKIEDNIYLEKTCKEHGKFRTIIWRGKPDYLSWYNPKKAEHPKINFTDIEKGCPFDCGLCPDHHQQICCALFEVTQRCNLKCPVCFADAGNTQEEDPSIEEIIEQMKIVWDKNGKCNVQLSGGEPTVRDDLPEIITAARSIGYTFFQLNTNGIRLGQDSEYVKALKEAGLSTVFLQFDGVKDETYQYLRGKNLLDAKQKAIENCRQFNLGVVLVPTLIPGVNTDQIGDIVRYALKGMPVIRGIHFQPISYFGRYPVPPEDEDRITLPEVLTALETQTQGLLNADNFAPSGCESSLCSFHGDFIYLEDERLTPFTQKKSTCECRQDKLEEKSVHKAQNYVTMRWQMPEDSQCCSADSKAELNEFDKLLHRIHNYRFSITCMTFQDVWNMDLQRLKYCSIPIISDGKAIPFCAYNVSNSEGYSLYRGHR